jgi:MtN3 and saliva related transmembrane protein
VEGWWLVLLGTVAGILTTGSFVPQLLKAWRAEGDTEAISKRMYVASTIAFGLWIAHGLMIGSVPIILFNALNLVFSGAILVLKLRGSHHAAEAA